MLRLNVPDIGEQTSICYLPRVASKATGSLINRLSLQIDSAHTVQMIKKKIQQVLEVPKDSLILATVENERIVRIHPDYEKLRKEDDEEEKSDNELYAFEVDFLADSCEENTQFDPSSIHSLSENYVMIILNLSIKVKIDGAMLYEKRKMPRIFRICKQNTLE